MFTDCSVFGRETFAGPIVNPFKNDSENKYIDNEMKGGKVGKLVNKYLEHANVKENETSKYKLSHHYLYYLQPPLFRSPESSLLQ